ncbi:MAG TPA: preprotein translocase subunit YajC [Candidatus Angelobacter sp.]|jgi:preprotein translocase subunit YajC|nr:preprotein translocase subunit YajC [Candidatus Angelobacter sp.]
MIENDISSFLLQAGGNPLGSFGMFLPLLFIFGIFYLLLILPQQRRQKRWQAMINDLKTGDRVTTQGGIRGSIIAIKDDAVHLRVPPDNLRLEVTKASVASVFRDEEPKKPEK